jgi:hypothetical protein
MILAQLDRFLAHVELTLLCYSGVGEPSWLKLFARLLTHFKFKAVQICSGNRNKMTSAFNCTSSSDVRLKYFPITTVYLKVHPRFSQ